MAFSFSIITTVLNAAGTIGDCLQSVASQSLAAEHIVVDGGSSDGTLEIVRRFARPGLQVVIQPGSGIYEAMNFGINAAGGAIVGTLNADDLYAHEHVLQRVLDRMKQCGAEALYGDLDYVQVGETSRVVRRWRSGNFTPASYRWGWMPPHPTFFLGRELYARHGGFNPALGSAADYELMLRLLYRHRVRAAYLPEVLVKMRMGGVSNASMINRLRANRMDRRAWQVNGLRPYPWTLTLKPLRKLLQFGCLSRLADP